MKFVQKSIGLIWLSLSKRNLTDPEASPLKKKIKKKKKKKRKKKKREREKKPVPLNKGQQSALYLRKKDRPFQKASTIRFELFNPNFTIFKSYRPVIRRFLWPNSFQNTIIQVSPTIHKWNHINAKPNSTFVLPLPTILHEVHVLAEKNGFTFTCIVALLCEP